MKSIIEYMTISMKDAFAQAGYEADYGQVMLSNRPDLCDYQCNGALAAAKKYKKSPFIIAQEVVNLLVKTTFEQVEVVTPGFINMKISREFLARYMTEMAKTEKFGCEQVQKPKTIIVDYGGPNVAKPLHVGHLRAAVIGEAVKRLGRYIGHNMIGDIHLGDWGLPIGLIITELKCRQPELIYFDEDYTGEYPSEAPFTISELEEIYPTASRKSKGNAEYLKEAQAATARVQSGDKAYRTLWKHILNVSVEDLKKNYDRLHVFFEFWKGESDVNDVIPEMVKYMKDNEYAYLSNGALVVDVQEESDNKEIPPCMILKSDGAALYSTTDLATIWERDHTYHADKLIYVIDKRQGLYFEQVFRCARKTKFIKEDLEMVFAGFGTMNGKDGKPFKTRDGGIMRLETLMDEIHQNMKEKIGTNRGIPEDEIDDIAEKVGLAAIKYGDLSNQPIKDYVFDISRFSAFEGNTGPYILYSIIRIQSVLKKYYMTHEIEEEIKICPAGTTAEKNLMLSVSGFGEVVHAAFDENAPNKLCTYIYEVANAFSAVYHDVNILNEPDPKRQAALVNLLELVNAILLTSIDILGFEAPARM